MYNNNEDLTDLSDPSTAFQINDKEIYQSIHTTFINIICPTDPFKEESYNIKNKTGLTRPVALHQNILDNNIIPSDTDLTHLLHLLFQYQLKSVTIIVNLRLLLSLEDWQSLLILKNNWKGNATSLEYLELVAKGTL